MCSVEKKTDKEDSLSQIPVVIEDKRAQKPDVFVEISSGPNNREWALSANDFERLSRIKKIGWRTLRDKGEHYHISRNPELFEAVLQYLQTGKVVIPHRHNYFEVQAELDYFGLRPRSKDLELARWTHDTTFVHMYLDVDKFGNDRLIVNDIIVWSEDSVDHTPVGWQFSTKFLLATTSNVQAFYYFVQFLQEQGFKITQPVEAVVGDVTTKMQAFLQRGNNM